MSAVLFPAFGNREAVRSAEVGNAAYNRAVDIGYSRLAAMQFARMAKKVAGPYETPAAVALRVVPPRQHSAMTRGPGPFGGRAA